MNRCQECGQHVSQGSRFCGSCGAATRKVRPSCVACAEPMDAEDQFCGQCGTGRAAVTGTLTATLVAGCTACGAEYPADDLFCAIDGARLVVRPAMTVSECGPEQASHATSLALFWARHRILAIMTLVVCAGGAIILVKGTAATGELPVALVGAGLLAIALSWPVALWRTDGVLATVDRMDGWFDKAANWAYRSNGRIRRFVVFPVLWIADRSRRLSLRSPDPFAAGAVRVFCYVMTLATIAALIFVAVVIVLFLVISAAAIMVAGMMLGMLDGSPRSANFQSLAVRGRGRKIYSGGGWLTDERTGRVDEQGRIFEGSNWLNERQVGRLGDDGTVLSGTNWINEQRVGRVDEEGRVYSGTNWINEQREGRIDEEGNVHRGSNWLAERRVGRLDDD